MRNVIGLSGTSLFKDEGFDPIGVPNSKDGFSILQTSGPRPKNIDEVSIRKYNLRDYSPPSVTIFDGVDHICTFEEFLDQYAHKMPRTMLRYSIEKMTDAKKKYYMNYKK